MVGMGEQYKHREMERLYQTKHWKQANSKRIGNTQSNRTKRRKSNVGRGRCLAIGNHRIVVVVASTFIAHAHPAIGRGRRLWWVEIAAVGQARNIGRVDERVQIQARRVGKDERVQSRQQSIGRQRWRRVDERIEEGIARRLVE